MIAPPRINAGQDSKLFTIESNAGFDLEPVTDNLDVLAVAAAFGAEAVTDVFAITKPSTTSVLYQIDCGAGPALMLRGAAPETASAVAAQCIAVNRLSECICVRPLLTEDCTGYTVYLNDKIWIAYHHRVGEIFDGRNCPLDVLFEKVFELENALGQIGPALPADVRESLPRTRFSPEAWPDLLDGLCADKAGSVAWGLGETAQTLLQENRAWVREIALRCANIAISTDAELVHNDINHANVLVGSSGISFLDIEDITFGVPEVSVAHAIFKLLRHRVYRDCASVAEARSEIDRIVHRLGDERWNLKSRTLLFDCAAHRIFSDIHLICARATESGDLAFLYDLEKKIHNLFELWKIVEPANELATR